MGRIILTIILLLWAVPTMAADLWCQWDGSKGTNCQSDYRGYIVIAGFNVKTPAIANAKGWFKLVTTEPTVAANQVKGTDVWAHPTNSITLTWTVRNKTTIELDEEAAQAMDANLYWLIKGLLAKGTFTLQEAQNFFPAEVIAAYQARARLEQ